MTVTEAVKLSGLTPSADYTGVETTDDFLLAVQTEAGQTDVKSWVVCADHVREHSGALNAATTDNPYIRTGPVTTKGSVQRTLSIQGDRLRAQARVSMRGIDKILGAGASARLGLNENDVSRLYDVLDEITQAAAAEKARYSRPAAVPQNRAQRRAEKRRLRYFKAAVKRRIRTQPLHNGFFIYR